MNKSQRLRVVRAIRKVQRAAAPGSPAALASVACLDRMGRVPRAELTPDRLERLKRWLERRAAGGDPAAASVYSYALKLVLDPPKRAAHAGGRRRSYSWPEIASAILQLQQGCALVDIAASTGR